MSPREKENLLGEKCKDTNQGNALGEGRCPLQNCPYVSCLLQNRLLRTPFCGIFWSDNCRVTDSLYRVRTKEKARRDSFF